MKLWLENVIELPKIPQNETERLVALYKLAILDTPPEQRFDVITQKVKNYFNVSYALISLIDKNRQWFKSNQGLAANETSRDVSFCGHAINYSDVFCVPDTLRDERFSDNPLVIDEPKIRFYAGMPVHTSEGFAVGTLCLIDKEPRMFVENDFDMLRQFAAMVEAEIADS